jgi:hypothetical protein
MTTNATKGPWNLGVRDFSIASRLFDGQDGK